MPLRNYIPESSEHVYARLSHLWITCEPRNSTTKRGGGLLVSLVITAKITLVPRGSQSNEVRPVPGYSDDPPQKVFPDPGVRGNALEHAEDYDAIE